MYQDHHSTTALGCMHFEYRVTTVSALALKLRKYQWFIVLLIFWSGTTFGQSGLDPQKSLTQYYIDSWISDDGLPNNAILDISKSDDGYLWLATYGGLVKFDGIHFTVYDTLFSVRGIRSLFKDKEGDLWIGSNGGGLVTLRNGQFEPIGNDSILGSSIISGMVEDQEGTLWIGTRNGLALYRNKVVERVKDPIISNVTVYAVYVDSKANVWIGTSGKGLFKYSKGAYQQITTSDGLINNSVRSIFEDDHGHLWIGTEAGVTRLSEERFQSFSTVDGLPHGYVNEIYQDSHGSLWFGTDGGLARYSNEVFEVLTKSDGLLDNTVEAILEDSEGSLWVGSYHGGLNRIKDGKFQNFSVPEGLAHEIVNAVYPEGSKIWVGTNAGLSMIENGKVVNYSIGENAMTKRIRDITRDSRGNLWICSSGGLIRFRDGHTKIYRTEDGLASNRIRRITEDNLGNLWIATAQGLNKLDVHGNFTTYGTSDGLASKFIMSVLCDYNNNIWVGTNGGGLQILNRGRFELASNMEGLSNAVIFNLTEDSRGNLWVASNGGLFQYKDGMFHSPTNKNGLISHTVFQLLEDNDKDRYWLFLETGLVSIPRLELQNEFLPGDIPLENVTVFDQYDGMRTNQITAVSVGSKTNDGSIIIPTVKGVSILDPHDIRINEVEPPVRIERLIVDHRENSVESSEIVFAPDSKSYEIHYAGLSFFAPEKVQYRYKLENFDEDWVDAGARRVAYYTSLPPGEYKFRVIASNNDGIWNDVGATLAFKQQAYFYQTFWFYVILGLFLIFIAIGVHSYRLHSLKKRNELLEQMVNDRTLKVQEKNEELRQLNEVKDKLFTIISHDLIGPINTCSIIFSLMKESSLPAEEFKKFFQQMGDKVINLKNLLENLLGWSRSQLNGIQTHMEPFELNHLINEDLRLFEHQAASKKIVIMNNIAPEEMVFADKNMIKLVLRNLISNSIKFTPPDGKIVLSSRHQNGHIEVSVTDTGVGISKEKQARMFDQSFHHTTRGTHNEKGTGLGLKLIKEFVEQNGGDLRVQSKVSKGSSFRVRLKRVE